MASPTFAQHYIDYLTGPGGLIAILVLIPVLWLLYTELLNSGGSKATLTIPGCFQQKRLSKSSLDDQYDSPATTATQEIEARVKALYVYPVKSCRGVELTAAEVTSTGLKYDRLFSFAQLVSSKRQAPADSNGVAETNGEITHQWRFITQRENPRLALLSTELWVPDPRQSDDQLQSVLVNGNPGKGEDCSEVRRRGENGTLATEAPVDPAQHKKAPRDQVEDWSANGGCLVIRFPYEKDSSIFGTRNETITIKIPLQPTLQRAKAKGYTYETMTIWKDCPQSINLSSEIDPDSLAKLKYFLGVSNPLGLFRVDDTNLRSITRSLPKDRPNEKYNVGFADAFPVHLLNIASVRAVDNSLPDEAKAKGKLDARRFRANIYVSGPTAYAEDEWMRIAVGEALNPHELLGNAEYHVACRTARCTLPNVHPDSGIKDRNEPHSTLKKTRQVDEGAKPHPCLGLSMIPLFKQGVVRVGDKIDVTERGEHVYEKMFK